ncbi:hypothetical protein ACFL6H_08385 [Candidatus Latescibacterota bacterium]
MEVGKWTKLNSPNEYLFDNDMIENDRGLTKIEAATKIMTVKLKFTINRGTIDRVRRRKENIDSRINSERKIAVKTLILYIVVMFMNFNNKL